MINVDDTQIPFPPNNPSLWEEVKVICGTNAELFKVYLLILCLSIQGNICDLMNFPICLFRNRNANDILEKEYTLVLCSYALEELCQMICDTYKPTHTGSSQINYIKIYDMSVLNKILTARERINAKAWLKEVFKKHNMDLKLLNEFLDHTF